MKSLANCEVRFDREPNGACNPYARQTLVTLLILTGCFVAEGLAVRLADAAPLVETAEKPRVPGLGASAPKSESAAQGAAPGAVVPARDGTTEIRLPDNASAELRRLARDAAAGQADAEHDLGTFFALGIEVPNSFEQAAYWYRRAADQGVASASYNLGVLLEKGLGVPRNSEAAVARFREAAAARHSGALNALGLACLSGSGTTRDPVEALLWFRRASAAGNPRGAYNVARLYENGELGLPDPRAAIGWYQVAADAGNEQAREALARLQSTAGTGGLVVSRVGFVGLVPGADPLPLSQVVMPDDDSDRILDDLAARLTVPAQRSRAATAIATGPDGTGTRPAAASERPVTAAEIAEIQRLLTQINLDAGRIDGRMGRKTRSAIAAFQRGHDLPITRRPSVALLEALRTATLVAQRD
ncbi:peptidoglycan-binding protein [Inquilinus sp. YAF38]|uniref:peptidoglycan-binding protein n=1 Tax=Inquilinus sp. YAF38 TaxID=3233084 RepID=UPI003F937095